MRRGAILVGSVAAISSVAVGHVAVAAPPGDPVVIVAHTDFTAEASAFDSTIEGCTSGTVVNGAGGAHFTPRGGAFAGLKEFTCTDGASGFTVNLTARFGGEGSTGNWRIVAAWGVLAGTKGSGTLVGIPISQTSIDDWYTGTIR